MEISNPGSITQLHQSPVIQTTDRPAPEQNHQVSTHSAETITIQSSIPDGASGDDYYQRPRSYQTFSLNQDHDDDPFAALLETNLTKRAVSWSPRAEGLVGAMAALVDADADKYSQDAHRTLYTSALKGFTPPDSQDHLSGSPKKGYSNDLRLTTKDGDEIIFSIRLGGSYGELADETGSFATIGASIRYSMTGDLSQSEKDSISRLIKGIESQISKTDMNAGPDLTRLGLFQNDEIASFSLTVKPEGQRTSLKLKFTNDQDGRSLFLEQGRHHLNIRTDNTPGLPSSTNREEALLNLVSHVKEAMDKGKGNANEIKLLTDAIGLIFEQVADAKGHKPPGTDEWPTDLPDYAINYHRRGTDPISSPDHLSLELGQRTRISQDNKQTRITQTQHSSLQAAYDEPLPHLERPDRYFGNFIANDLKEEMERTTELAWDAAGIPVKAEAVLKSDVTHMRKTVNEGELESHDHQRRILEETIDLLLPQPLNRLS